MIFGKKYTISQYVQCDHPLRTVERNRLRVVLTPKINDRLNQLDRRISRIQARIQEVYVDANHQKALKTLLTRDFKNNRR